MESHGRPHRLLHRQRHPPRPNLPLRRHWTRPPLHPSRSHPRHSSLGRNCHHRPSLLRYSRQTRPRRRRRTHPLPCGLGRSDCRNNRPLRWLLPLPCRQPIQRRPRHLRPLCPQPRIPLIQHPPRLHGGFRYRPSFPRCRQRRPRLRRPLQPRANPRSHLNPRRRPSPYRLVGLPLIYPRLCGHKPSTFRPVFSPSKQSPRSDPPLRILI